MKYFLAALFISSCLVTGAYAEQVCGVDDGDTLVLCSGKKVRLHGVDAAELHQPAGAQARDHLKALVVNKDVQLQCVSRGMLRDMCSVTLEGKDIQAEMVQMGYAFDYPKYSHGKYRPDQDRAKAEKRGLWIQSEGSIKTWDARRK